tara:strand:- start:3638 stop:12481 length:8844 start_codon:yes stop_codon:yes gene_type:complete
MPLGIGVGNFKVLGSTFNRYQNTAPVADDALIDVNFSTGGYGKVAVPTNFSTPDDPWNWLIVQPGAGWHFNKDNITADGEDRKHLRGFVTPSPGRYFFVKNGEYAGSRVFIEGSQHRDGIEVAFGPPTDPFLGQTVIVGGNGQSAPFVGPNGENNLVGFVANYDGSQWNFARQRTRFIPDGRAVVIVGDSPNDTDAFAGNENRFALLQSGSLAGVDISSIAGMRLMKDHVGFWTKFADPGEVVAIVSNVMLGPEPLRNSGGQNRDPVEGRVRSQASDIPPGGPLVHMDGVWVEDEDTGRFLSHSGEIATYSEQDDSWSFRLPPDKYYAKDNAGDTYVFSLASRSWTKVEDPESLPAFVLAKTTKARETISNTSMTKSKDGRVFFAVAYTDFSETVNINPLTNYWIQDDILGKDGTQHSTYASDFSYPFVLEDQRKIFVSYASRRMEVYETTDGQSSGLIDGWINSVNIEDSEAISTNVASHDGVLSYNVAKGGIVGSHEKLPYGPSVIEPCIVIRPDGMLQVYGASHNWLPPQYEGLHNDSKLNDGYISSIPGTAYRSGQAMHAAVINGMASATIDIEGDSHRLDPSVNTSCSRNVVAPGDLVYDDQFTSSALAVSTNGLADDAEDDSSSPLLKRRSHARKLDTRRATAAFLANPIAGGFGCGLVTPGLVSIVSPNGITYNMAFMWGVYPKRPSISVDSTKTVSRYEVPGQPVAGESVLSVGRVEKVSPDRFGGIDFVAISVCYTPPPVLKVGDVFLVKEDGPPRAASFFTRETASGPFEGKANNLACYEPQPDGTLGFTFRSRFPANSKLLVLEEGRDGVYTAIISSSTSGSNIESWDRGLTGESTVRANVSWSSGEATVDNNAAMATIHVVSATFSPVDGQTYIKYSNDSTGVGRHLVGKGLFKTIGNVLDEIRIVLRRDRMIVVGGGGTGRNMPVSGDVLTVFGRVWTITSSTLYNSGIHDDLRVGDYFVKDLQKYYISERPIASNVLKVYDSHHDVGDAPELESGTNINIIDPGGNDVYDSNAMVQSVYWHSDNSGKLPRRPANQFAGFIGGYSGLDAISTDSGVSVVSSKIYQQTYGNGSVSTILMLPGGGSLNMAAAWPAGFTANKRLVVYRGEDFLFYCIIRSVGIGNYSMTVTLLDYENTSPRSLSPSPTDTTMKVFEADTTSPFPKILSGGDSATCGGFDVLEYSGGDRRFLRSISQYSQKDAGGVEFGFRPADTSSITENRTFYWHPIKENLGRTDSASSVGGNLHWEETALASDTFLHQSNISHAESTSLDVLNRRFRLIGGRYYGINWFGDVSPTAAGMTVFAGQDAHLSVINAGSTMSGEVFSRTATGLRQRRNVLAAGSGFHVSKVRENLGAYESQAVLAEPFANWLSPVDAVFINDPSTLNASNGFRVIVGNSPTGAFSGHAGEIANYDGSSWSFTSPSVDDAVDLLEIPSGEDEFKSYVYEGSSWRETVRESAIQIFDTLLYDDNGTQRVATVRTPPTRRQGYRPWRPGYFNSAVVEELTEDDPRYSENLFGTMELIRIRLTATHDGMSDKNIRTSDAIRLVSGGKFYEIEYARMDGSEIILYTRRFTEALGTSPLPPPWNGLVQSQFLTLDPPLGAVASPSNIEIRHTVVLDFGFGVEIPYDIESNRTMLMNFHTPVADTLISAGRLALDPTQLSPSDLNNKHISPRLPSGSSSGNLYEVQYVEQSVSEAHIDVSNCLESVNSATRVTTFSAFRASGIPNAPGGIFFGDWNYTFTRSSTSYDANTGITVIDGVSTTSEGFWSYLSSSPQKYITGTDSHGDAFTYKVESATESSQKIEVSGSSAATMSQHLSVHTLESGGTFWGDTKLNSYNGTLPFTMLTISYIASEDALEASFIMDDPNYDGMASRQNKLYDDASYIVGVNTIATNGSRLTDEQPGFMYDIYSSVSSAPVAAIAQKNGGSAFTLTKDSYSIASIGTGVDFDGIHMGNRLPFPYGFGCAPVHDSLKQTHHADPFAGGFRVIFAPINTNSEVSGGVADENGVVSPLSSNIFFSMLLHGSSWNGYAGNRSSDGVAGVLLRAKLITHSAHKEVVLEVVDAAQELKAFKVSNGSVVSNDAAEVLGKASIKFDGLQDLNFVECLVGMESSVSVSSPDEAPTASIVHAFARPVDAEGKSNRSFSTICNYRRLQHGRRFASNPFNFADPSVEEVQENILNGVFNSGNEHFMFGVSAKGVRRWAYGLSETPSASGISMVVKQVSVHRPGNALSGSGLIALNSDLERNIETISAPMFDKAAYGTQFTELKPIQVASASDTNFAVGDVFTRGASSGLEQCGINPSSILSDDDTSCSPMSFPQFLGTFGDELILTDAGVLNPNRGAMCKSMPQEISSGISVSWRGNSATRSSYALSTYYDYSFKNAFEQSLSKVWATGTSPENDSLNGNYYSGKSAGRSYKSNCKLYTVPSIQIVLDSQGDHGDAASGDLVIDVEHQLRSESNFVPDGVAVFGRNWGNCTFEFCDYDSFDNSLGSYRRYEVGQPGDSWAYDPTSSVLTADPERYSHLWAWTNRSDTRPTASITPIASGSGNSKVCFGDRTFSYNADTTNAAVADQNTPWIPHQFRSTDNGAKFYLQVLCRRVESGSFAKTSNKLVFKIIDNTADTLILDTNPLKCLDAEPSTESSSGASSMPWHTVSIYSDRFALQLYNYQNTTTGSSTTQSKPTSYTGAGGSYAQSHHRPGVGFRYMRITICGATRLSQAESSHKLGRIVLGKVKSLAGPDFDWGWSRKEQSGTNITTFNGGQRIARKVHEPRRVFDVSHAPLMPKHTVRNGQSVWESTSRGFGSGTGEFYSQSTRTWNEVLEMLRSLGFGAVQAALVFDDASNAVASHGSDRSWQSNPANSYDEISYVTVPSEPSNLMLVRMTSVGEISHEGYVCRDVVVENGSFKHSNGTGPSAVLGSVTERPSPAIKIASIVFEEEL